jgi:hypothetical protein
LSRTGQGGFLNRKEQTYSRTAAGEKGESSDQGQKPERYGPPASLSFAVMPNRMTLQNRDNFSSRKVLQNNRGRKSHENQN